jgi:peptidyl-prolyl cis-trans isomerase B (cyclophilin B)
MASLLLCALAPMSFTLHAARPATSYRANPLVSMCESPLITDRRTLTQTIAAAAAVTISPLAASADGYPQLSMMTTEGEMQFELWNDVAPKHVESFLKLTKEGFYDGGAFHRIIPGFVIQGGDPNAKVGYGPGGTLEGGDKKAIAKWGRGGPGYNVPAEFNDRIHEFGVLSMARAADPNSAGSQFFVCLGRLQSLDNKYTTFGKLIKGDDVLKRIAAAKTVAGDIPEKRQGIERVDRI